MWFLLLISCLLFWVLRYYRKSQLYWRGRGIDGPPSTFFLGNFWELYDINKPHGLVLKEWAKKYGRVFGIQEGLRNILIVSDQMMLQELFVKKFDDFYGRKNQALAGDVDNEKRVNLFQAQGVRWKRLRTICASSFSSNSLRKIKDTVEDSAIELTNLLEKHADSDPIDIHKFYQEYTMDVISRVSMGQVGSKMFQNPLCEQALQIFQRNMRNPISVLANSVPLLRPVLRRAFNIWSKLYMASILPIFQGIYKTVDERIAQREKDALEGIEPGEPSDFVDLFLDARAEEANDNGGSLEYTKDNVKVSRVLTKEEIVAQCFIFLLAGFDTTSNALSYASWLLSKHPEVQKKVQREIEEVCGNDQTINYDSISKLKYTEAVIKETLRLFPLASIANSRSAMRDTSLGNIKIEKGTVVQANSWALHYDKEIWGEDAEEFVPERWEDEKVRHNNAWIAFGAGPRVCIGMRLAYMEAKLALVHILRKFNIVQGPLTENPIGLVGSTTVSPSAVTVYLKQRVDE